MEKIELETESRELVAKRVPPRCPFCYQIDGVEWFEFEVLLAHPVYVQADEKNAAYQGHGAPRINVFCTRCKEEIREEDVR